MKNFIKAAILYLVKLIGITAIGRFIENSLITEAMSKSHTITHNGCSLTFATPNPLTRWRAETFSTKEPETLVWIDGMNKDAVLWDIGANVGLYSIYAGKKHGIRTFSFEPSVFNLELLGRNIHLNNASEKVTIAPFALTDKTGVNIMRHADTAWGGALSSFGATFDANGDDFNSRVEYSTYGFSADDLVSQKLIPQPNHIKIDVDGIEHLILKGAINILKKVTSILVEVNDDFTEQADTVADILTKAEFTLSDKQISPFTQVGENKVYNQIWKKL